MDLIEFINDSVIALAETWKSRNSLPLTKLNDSIAYSFTRGGKRFRPLITVLIADIYAVGPKRVLPWALAIEMIHTYSLIHDDLPCMDNDDLRRGEPTNHKVFGETTALLAGDALLTEAFLHLAKSYQQEAELGIKLISLLGEAAGLQGMVGGQALDIAYQSNKASESGLVQMHSMKTGALIRAAAEGAAVACGLTTEKISVWRVFGEKLGLAFQIKDDILDATEKVELCSFPAVIGLQESKKYLDQVHQDLKNTLEQLNLSNSKMSELIEFNQIRQK